MDLPSHVLSKATIKYLNYKTEIRMKVRSNASHSLTQKRNSDVGK